MNGEDKHIPVMLREILEALEPRSGQRFVDGTLGRGGHAAALLEQSSPDGFLLGLDRDQQAIDAVAQRLAPFSGRFELHHANYDRLLEFVAAGSCDAVLLDLGISSPQIDQADRGFSFQNDGPLDMRMDQSQEMTAADIVNTWPVEDLSEIFWKLGEERFANRIARAIDERRAAQPFTRTKDLADFVARQVPRGKQKIHPATRVFQALRMAVNQELESLEAGLEAAFGALKAGGRAAIVTFHSLEDRMVKEWGRALARDYDFTGNVDLPEFRQPRAPRARWVSRKPIQPGDAEVRENPRSRSAKLRVLEKLEAA